MDVKKGGELVEYIEALYDDHLGGPIKYSKDITKTKEEQDSFIKYVKLFVHNKIAAKLFLERRKNILKYGQIIEGEKKKTGTISMSSSSDLQKIYNLLKFEFFDSFKEGYANNIIDDLCLLPILGENLTIMLDSSNIEDKKWIHNEYNKTEEIIIAVHGMQSNCMKKRDDILAQEITKNNISYFCFNNRGHDLINSITKRYNGKTDKILSGSSLECVQDGYYDIKTAILKMLEKGYKKIHLQGHSLGCTKIVYTYIKMKSQNEIELLSKIKSIMLLSMVDVPVAINFFFQNDIYKLISDMEKEQKEGNGKKVMLIEGATFPMCPDTFLNFAKNAI